MPALAADIEAATRPNGVTLDTQADPAVLAAYPNAIDGSASPAGGYCDDMAHTALLNAQRFALLKVPRRRFRTEADRDLPALRTNGRTPTVQAVDSEVRANGPFLVSGWSFDRDSERTGIEIYG
jgi:hypothetical protein